MSPQPRLKLRIRELRAKNRWTQAELAKRSKLSKTTICNLESEQLRRIQLGTIAQLCAAFHCTPNDLFEITSESEDLILQSQKEALNQVLGTMHYSEPIHPDMLNIDLADLTERRLETDEQ